MEPVEQVYSLFSLSSCLTGIQFSCSFIKGIHSLTSSRMWADCPSLVSFCPSIKNKDPYSSIKSIAKKILCKVEGLQLHSSSLSSVFRRHSHYFYLLLKTFAEVKKKSLPWMIKIAGGAEINICLIIDLFT